MRLRSTGEVGERSGARSTPSSALVGMEMEGDGWAIVDVRCL